VDVKNFTDEWSVKGKTQTFVAPIDPINLTVIALGCGCCFNLAKTINLETVSHGCCCGFIIGLLAWLMS
jgi:hypothetical protein